MPSSNAESKPTASSTNEYDSLVQVLLSRGLAAREEIQACEQAKEGPTSPESLLKRLVKSGAISLSQGKRIAQEFSSLASEQIPGYQVMEKLGMGSMGTVYKARQLSMNRLVALKMLHPRMAAKSELLQRLVKEAHLAAKLSHNNIVQAIDVGTAGSLHYFVMEYIEGTTIKQELEKGKIYEEREALQIILQIAGALQHAHRRGLIHRDVKPANIILTKEGVAKLADLGMARETEDEAMAKAEKGMTIGTPFYISTEQIYGEEDIDARADIYSLGGTLYHMVTGQPPFPGTKVDDVLEAHLKQELTPPDQLNLKLSSGLGEMVEYMMMKERKDRYANCDDLIIDLECLLHGEPPKLARAWASARAQRESSSLAGLAEGASEDDERRSGALEEELAKWRLGVMITGPLLALSALANLILFLKR